MGLGSLAAGEPALGHGSFVDAAGGTSPPHPQTPAAHVRDPETSGSRTRMQRAGAMMSELRFLPDSVVAAVADREGVPAVVAHDLAGRAVLNAAIRAERRQRERSNPRWQFEREDSHVDRA